MTLEEAIEIVALDCRGEYKGRRIDLEDALKLGIEAGKRVQLARKEFGYIDPSLLPGETQD